jgi:hypothetical protein
MKLTINKDRLLGTVLPALFESNTTYVLELLQNAQRAKAKTVSIELDSKSFSIVDDGCGCDDLSVLLEMATTGWQDCNENPFGMGFLSLAPIAKKAVVWSKGKKLTINFDKLNDECAVIEDAQYLNGFSVYVEGREALCIPSARVVKLVRHMPFSVTMNGEVLESNMPYDYGVEYKGNGYTFYIPETPPSLVLHRVDAYAFNRPCGHVSLSYAYGTVRLDGNTIDLKAPDHSSVIVNEKYFTLVRNMMVHFKEHLLKYGGSWDTLRHYLTDDELWNMAEVELLTPMYLEQIRFERAGVAPNPGTVITSPVAPDAVSNYVPSKVFAKDVKNGVCCTKDWAFENHGLVHKLLVAGIPVVIAKDKKQLEFLESRGIRVARNIHDLEILTLTIVVLEPTQFEKDLIGCYNGVIECPIVIAEMDADGAYRDGVIYLKRRQFVNVTPPQAALIVSVIIGHELAHAQGYDDNTKQHSMATEENTMWIIAELLR